MYSLILLIISSLIPSNQSFAPRSNIVCGGKRSSAVKPLSVSLLSTNPTTGTKPQETTVAAVPKVRRELSLETIAFTI